MSRSPTALASIPPFAKTEPMEDRRESEPPFSVHTVALFVEWVGWR